MQYNGYERNECVHGGIEWFKEQYSPSKIDIRIRDLDMNRAQQSRVHAVEISYLRKCSITRLEDESKVCMKDVAWDLVQKE